MPQNFGPQGVQPMPTQAPGNPMQGEAPISQGQGMNYISQEDLIDDREAAFEQAFKDTAYNIFSTKHPEMVPEILTFKVIKSSINEGDAVGAFIIQHMGEELYVPLVMSDNQMKPLELFYAKKMDKFLPFKKEWLEVVSLANEEALGEGVKTPEMLPGDKDISRLIQPPLQGRTSYAMDFSGIDHLDLIKEASNTAKESYRTLLQGNKAYAKFAFENFGQENILDALSPHQEKVASVPTKLETVDLNNPTMRVKEVFGHKANEAIATMARDGFAFKDERVDLNDVVSTSESKMQLVEPTTSGVYTVYGCDGTPFTVLIVVNPEDLNGGPYGELVAEDSNREVGSVYGDWRPKPTKERRNYMCIREDGDYYCTQELIASPSDNTQFKGPLADVIFGDKKPGPVTKSNICFIKVEGDIVSGTTARYVDVTETGRNGYKSYLKYDPYASKSDTKIYREKESTPSLECKIIHSSTPTGKILKPKGSSTTFIPQTYKVVKLGNKVTAHTYLTSANEVLNYAQKKINETGGRTVKLANLGYGEYGIDGRYAGDLHGASVKLAEEYRVPMDIAVGSFKKLAMQGDHVNLGVIPPEGQEKTASIFAAGTDGAQMTPELIQQQAMLEQQQQEQAMQQAQPNVPVEGPNTSMMDIGMQTQDPELYSVGVLNSLSKEQDIRELLSVYAPALEKSLDNTGRMLLTFWIRGSDAKETLGEETYNNTEESLRTVFKELGTLLLKLNNRASAIKEV